MSTLVTYAVGFSSAVDIDVFKLSVIEESLEFKVQSLMLAG